MTTQEAIEIIKKDGWGYPETMHTEAMMMAIDALGKQTPKIPNIDSSFHACCPNLRCSKQFFEKYQFCPDCGQALDWSEVEE